MAGYPLPSGAPPIRPPLVGSTSLPQNFGPPMPVQFRPVDLTQQSHQFIPPPSQHFQPTQGGMPSSIAGMPPSQFVPSVQQIIPRPTYPGQSVVPSQPIPMPYIQPNMPIPSGLMQSQQNSQFQSNHMLNQGGGGVPLSSSYTFSTPYDSQVNTVNAPSHYQPISQMRASVPLSVPLHNDQKSAGLPVANSLLAPVVSTINVRPIPTQQPSDWQEHASSDGKRYYYNKKTKQSSWEKPVELMTHIERVDASTPWKEYTSPDGRKYYYNKLTKQSKWTIPDELKLAREQAERTAIQLAQQETGAASLAPVSVSLPLVHVPSPFTGTSNLTSVVVSSPSVSLAVNSANPTSTVSSGSPSVTLVPSTGIPSNSLIGTTNATAVMLSATIPITPLPAPSSASSAIADETIVTTTAAATKISNENSSFPSAGSMSSEIFSQEQEEAKRGISLAENISVIPQEKLVVEEPVVYANKQEAKAAFKALLESASIESDWTWEQAMRVIINDKRYGALKTLGERKQVFSEFLGERKKQENEERRVKQKRIREEFIKMLEESKELTSSTRWRKAETMFESDERFNAIERVKDREDIFETYIGELRKKEKAKAAEEHKQNIMEYRAFLESCDFIKASSQWRKVQDRLESDERCSRLDKFDRLKTFQDYVNDLEKEEEEQQKMHKEQMRKAERKNRDDFRKLMEEHVAAGILTAKTHWRDYYIEVKDLPSYLAVSSNTSGATPKDLFEDVTEELEKQYHEDKTRIKDAVKIGKIALTPSSTFEGFKADTSEEANLQNISETNLKLIFKELLEKVWDKEEREAKRRQRLADNFSNLLHSAKEISATSTWEECKTLLADYQQYSSTGEENLMRDIFEKYVEHLQEKAKEKERKRDEEKSKKERGREDREKKKDRKEKERDHERETVKRRSRKDDMEEENVDVVDTSSLDDKTRGKDKERRHRKHHRSTTDEKEGKEKSKKSRRHSSARKKPRKHSSESDSENQYRKRKRDRDGSHRNNSYEDLEDGELGDYGENMTRQQVMVIQQRFFKDP